jgi:hypothetical protein
VSLFRTCKINAGTMMAMAVILVVWAGGGVSWASPQISGAMARAIRRLGSSRYAVREKAAADLRLLLADQLHMIIQATSAERQVRLMHLLEFDEHIARWTLAVMRRPQANREALFNWGLSPQVAPLIAEAFAHRPSVQMKAARGLAALWPQSQWLVHRMLESRHRLVYLSMLSAIWNIKPDKKIIDQLWRWSVTSGYPMVQPNVHQHLIKFRNQVINVTHFVNLWQRVQDGIYATQVLRHWNPAGLKSLLTTYARTAAEPNTPAAQTLASPSMTGCRNYLSLFAKARPRAAVPYLLKILHSSVPGGINFNFNNQQVHWDNHTTIVYLLILAAHKKPADYHFFHSQLYGGSWLTGTPAEQLSAQKRIVAWWHKHHVTSAGISASAKDKPSTRQ